MDTHPYLTTTKTVAQTRARQTLDLLHLSRHLTCKQFSIARQPKTKPSSHPLPLSSNSHGAQQPVKPWLRHLHPPMTHCPCGHGALHLTSTPILCYVIQHFYRLFVCFPSFLFLSFPSQAVTAQARGLFATTIGGCRACAAIQHHGGDKKRMNGEDGNESRERAYRQAIDTGREGMAGRVKTGLG